MGVPAPCVIVISGLPGAGKSTTARLVAEKLTRAAHVEADQLQYMILAGGVLPDGTASPGPEAEAQLALRLRNACVLARSFQAVADDDVVDRGRTPTRRSTPRIGLWLDTTRLTAADAASEIVARLDEARWSP